MSYFQDVRYALRIMGKNPGFASAAVVALALGIGANTTVFTITNAILWKNLPFKDPQQIAYLGCSNPAKGLERLSVSYPDFEDWRREAKSFQGLEAFSTGTMNVSDGSGVPERMNGNWVTAGAFRLIGQSTLLGRDFLAGEDRRGAQPVVILGYGIWQTRYGGDRGILGRTIRVNTVPATVVGVMPQGMRFPYNAALWMPLIPSAEQESREVRGITVFGRLLPGLSMAQARTEMDGIGRRLEQAYPKTNEGIAVEVMSFNERYNGHWRMRLVLLILMAAVGFVLLIACVNVANLLLSRAACRAKEISIRTAIGAGRGRIVRQLLIESTLLCLAGGGVSLLLAVAGVRSFEMSLAGVEGMPYWIDFSLDLRVLAYVGTVCVLTTVLFGLAPALKALQVNLVDTLKDGGYGTTGGPHSRRLTSSLVVTQLALTAVLLFGAGLMMRDFLRVQQMGVGIRPASMLTMRLGLPEEKYDSPADRIAFHDRLAQRFRAVAGIQSTAITSHLPWNGSVRGRLEIEGQAVADPEKLPMVSYLVVSPGYFETMGVSLVRGRDFGSNDGAAGAEAVIVNERFAARHLPGGDPVGRRIRLGSKPEMPWLTVVGVSPHIWQSPDDKAETESVIYVPYRQEAVRFASIVARSLLPPSALAQTLRSEVQTLDPDLPLYFVKTMEDHLSQNLWPYRVFGGLFMVFGGIALILSAVGIYAVTAYSVARRTHEIGIRVSIGAGPRDVLWLVLRQGLRQLLLGLVLGLLGAMAVGRAVAALLLETTGTDPLTMMSISLLLIVIALLACVIPARRANRLDPLAALRTSA